MQNAILSTATGPDGSFEVEFPFTSDAGIDLELNNDDGSLDEFVDFGKKAKPCYLEFASGKASEKNRLRTNEEDTTGSISSIGIVDPVLHFVMKPRELYDLDQDSTFLNGRFPLYQTTQSVLDIVSGDTNVLDNPNGLLHKVLSVGLTIDTNHSWCWGDYAIHLTAGPVLNAPLQWTFYDETGDYYSLAINASTHSHILNYKSAKPAILKFTTSH